MATQGDGFFVVFPSASASVAAAIEMQLNLAAHTWSAGDPVQVRMGLHSGEAAQAPTGLVGFDVHRAARVAAVAHGGQILVSESTVALVRDSLPPQTTLVDLGLHRLKDLGRPQQLFQLQATALRSSFPPLRSLDHPELANNLPAQSATFIGRDRELEEVRALLRSSRLVTLTGAGGSGKTRLALQVAAELLDGSRDGVWLVELGAVTEEEALVPSIIDALGITVGPGRPILDGLLEVLAAQEALIILDNCEHLISMCAKAAEAILRRCPRVHVLTTSREPLGLGGESVYRVPSLSLPAADEEDPASLAASDAVVLFLERARSQGVELALNDVSGPLVASTCRRLDGMPLAIELAVARLRSLPLSSLHDMLDKRFRLLTGGSRTALERQQTLRATVDWSYSLLTESERSLLRRLSVFVDGFDLEAASAVCAFGDIEEFDVTDLLGSLVDKSLVIADPAAETGRYRLLETIRQFAAERSVEFDESEATTAAAAHGEHFLAVAETAAPHLMGPQAGRWLARLDLDHANLRRAIERAADDPAPSETVARFAVALGYYWNTRARRREAFELLMPGVQRGAEATDPHLYAEALLMMANFAVAVDRESALALVNEGLELARGLDDEPLLVRALASLAAIRTLGGDHDAALLAREALERARGLGADELLANCLVINIMCWRLVDPSRAEPLYREALACAERTGNPLLTHDMTLYAGQDALIAGDLSAAREHLERAARLGQSIGAASHYASVQLGMLLREEGDREQAGAVFQEAVRAIRRNGDRMGLAYATLGLACLAADETDWRRAAGLHGAVEALTSQLGQNSIRYDQIRRDSLETIRSNLPPDEFERALATGRGLDFEAVVALARGTTHASATAVG